MNIGVPRERRPFEFRVGLSPMGVGLLTAAGHVCFVERAAGVGVGYSDDEYAKAGGRVVYSPDEAFGRADLVLKVARPTTEEIAFLHEGQALLGLLHLAAARPEKIALLLQHKVTTIAYEQIRLDDGSMPVLRSLSQIGGRMTPQIAASLLQNNNGGTGVLLGGAPGVPPAEVAILGAGTAGFGAARAFLAMDAHVTVLDRNIARLQEAEVRCGGHLTTLVSYPFNVARVCQYSDVLVSAVLVPGERTPVLVSREVVRSMKPRSVIIDLDIDEGGSVETARPTTHDHPTFVAEGVTHYCVPNVGGIVARTATHAFLNAAWPFIQLVAEKGASAAFAANPALRRALVTHDGILVTHHD
jgi:alanine dehydrogenase